MYTNADIDSLSVGQLRKLLKGGAVRVRCGSGMKVGLSAPQHKKLMSAHKKGKMMTLTMDPYQMEMHGQGLFGDIGQFFSRKVPSVLIHQGLPEAGSALGGMAGSYLGGPMGSLAGSKLGRLGGQKLAQETGRRTGRGQPIEDQQFSLSDVARTGKRLFGRGQPIEDQQFSLSDVARTGKRLFGGKKGQGVIGDAVRRLAPQAKKLAQEVATKVARKVGRKALDELPSMAEQLGEMAGDYAGVRGGKQAGRTLGQMAEREIVSRTGLGMKLKGKVGGALMVAGVR